MKTDLMTRVQDNALYHYVNDQLRRQRLASLGLISFGLKAASDFASDPRKQAEQLANLGPNVWQTLTGFFADLVKEGQRVSSTKVKR